jgi:hypothetical protein
LWDARCSSPSIKKPTFIVNLLIMSWGTLLGVFLAPYLFGLFWKAKEEFTVRGRERGRRREGNISCPFVVKIFASFAFFAVKNICGLKVFEDPSSSASLDYAAASEDERQTLHGFKANPVNSQISAPSQDCPVG